MCSSIVSIVVFICLVHLLRYLHQCWFNKCEKPVDDEPYRNEELLAGVQSYYEYETELHMFDWFQLNVLSSRIHYSLPNNIMTHSLDRSHLPLLDGNKYDRPTPLVLSSRSNEHSPKHRHASLTPTNNEQRTVKLTLLVVSRMCLSFSASFLVSIESTIVSYESCCWIDHCSNDTCRSVDNESLCGFVVVDFYSIIIELSTTATCTKID
jgi:hypothetical protein